MRAEATPASELKGITELEDEHREAGELHAEVERLYEIWMESDKLGAGGWRRSGC